MKLYINVWQNNMTLEYQKGTTWNPGFWRGHEFDISKYWSNIEIMWEFLTFDLIENTFVWESFKPQWELISWRSIVIDAYFKDSQKLNQVFLKDVKKIATEKEVRIFVKKVQIWALLKWSRILLQTEECSCS